MERSKFSRKLTLDEAFTLAPGATGTRSAELPLGVDTSAATMQEVAGAAGLPAGVGTAISASIGSAGTPVGRHRIEVVLKLAGSTRLANASTSITAQ
jgi:hypothetical protein